MMRGINGPFPVLQAALDYVDTERALQLAHEAVSGGADWLEAGTPLIKSEGFEAVRRLRAAFPDRVIMADLKTMDTGRLEFEAAAVAGANTATVLACAADATITQCVEVAHKYGLKTFCDMINIPICDYADQVKRVTKLGVDVIIVQMPIDEQMLGSDPLAKLKVARANTDLTLAVAGGVTSETAPGIVMAGASIIIVGGALLKAADTRRAAQGIRAAIDSGVARPSEVGRRTDASTICDALLHTTTCDLSDAMHHKPCLYGIQTRTPGQRMAGQAFTVRTCPGDWSKVAQAIDAANPGDVLVADCAGVPPAVFGELAAASAKNKNLAGVVIHGAIRGTEIGTRLGIPLFSTSVCSNTGEPKGFGEMGVEVNICGQPVRPGDWIFGDDDGVMVLPREQAVEYANRALDMHESQQRIAAEIRAGKKTLAAITNLRKWEKQ